MERILEHDIIRTLGIYQDPLDVLVMMFPNDVQWVIIVREDSGDIIAREGDDDS